MKSLLFSFLFAFSFSLFPFFGKKELPPPAQTIQVEKSNLTLNGIGLRKVRKLGKDWEVYRGALYLKEKANQWNKVKDLEFPKAIEMTFLRFVASKKLTNGFVKAFKNSNGDESYKKHKKALKKFNSQLPDFKRSHSMTLHFLNSGVKVFTQNKKKKKDFIIDDPEFSKALFNIWFEKTLDPNLTKGLLGEAIK